MENQIVRLKKTLLLNDIEHHFASDNDILSFENEHGLLIPQDLKLYFNLVNGNKGEYDEQFFSFYSLLRFKNIDQELKGRNGIPNYSNLVNVLQDHQYCFVFCDYEFHLFSYAIRLYSEPTKKNEVYVLCGDKYKVITTSFTSFLELYFIQSDDLLL